MHKPRLYFDNAASTPINFEAKEAMMPFFDLEFGNPGSLHSFGQRAIAALDKSRETFSRILECDFRQIIFTSSASEANNLVLRGAVKKWKEKNKGVPKIIISSIEHESVLKTADDLRKEGVETVLLPVNQEGFVDLEELEKEITPNTVLVSVVYANNETGVLQDISKISSIVQGKRAGKIYPLFHSDAVQAFQYLECVPKKLGLDFMTLSSHKIYGPKGAALLFAADLGNLAPIISGGGQEFGLRSGTENVPAIVGFARAAEIVSGRRSEISKKVGDLSRKFLDGLKGKFEINGPEIGNNTRVPGILNLCFPGKSAETLLAQLDLEGVAASSGSACRSRSSEISHVLLAMGLGEARAKSSLRFSFGDGSSKEDIDTGVIILGQLL